MADNIADLILGGDPGTHLLQEAFAFDITLTKIRCAACNTVSCLGLSPSTAGRWRRSSNAPIAEAI